MSGDGDKNKPSVSGTDEERTEAEEILDRLRDVSLSLQPTTSGSEGGASASGTPLDTAKLPLKIRTLDGKTFNIKDAKTTWTVRQLKEEFATWAGQGWDNIGLFYKAKRLNDNELLSKYKIEPDSFIQANYRSKGGEWLILRFF